MKGDAADDPDFSESDDELNIKPAEENPCIRLEESEEDQNKVKGNLLDDFIEDDIGDQLYVNEEDEDELDIMDAAIETKPKKDYTFLPDHPQYSTHQAHMQKMDSLVVPNFLPNSLPRSDCGDREYYCCTMLTLFKPWRSGKDLKCESESWDKSFVAHEFTKRQIDIMKNFNVRYECLDARDDYSTQRDKDNNEQISYPWATSDNLSMLDDIHDREHAFEAVALDMDEHYEHYEDMLKIPGKYGHQRNATMASAERTMRMAGWMDECADGLPDVGPLKPLQTEVEQSGKAWRAAVLARKQEIIDERNKDIPSTTKKKTTNNHPDFVEVVDKTYINKLFKLHKKADENIIKTSIEKFHLNSEQERAF